jgi:hypothetical protein
MNPLSLNSGVLSNIRKTILFTTVDIVFIGMEVILLSHRGGKKNPNPLTHPLIAQPNPLI